jgi:hypothetical protein
MNYGIQLAESEGLFHYFSRKSHKYGYLNLEGKYAIQPQFDAATPFKNGYAAVQKNGKWGFINTSGVPITGFDFDSLGDFSSEGLAPVVIKEMGGFINTKGEVAIPLIYGKYLDSFNHGIARVKFVEDMFINTTGKTLFGGKHINFNYRYGIPAQISTK